LPDRILVADDDPLQRAIAKDMLAQRGYEVVEAADGREVIAHVGLAPPDLILLDLNMPVMDGYAVLSQLKAEEATRFIPIVVVTGHDAPQSRLESLELGADDFLSKPVEPSELIARVHSLLRFKHLNDQLINAYQQMGQIGQIAEGLFQAEHPLAEMGEVVLAELLREAGESPLHPTRLWVGEQKGRSMEGLCFQLAQGRLESRPSGAPAAVLERYLAQANREGVLFWKNGPMSAGLCPLFRPDSDLDNMVGMAQNERLYLAAGYGHAVSRYDAQVLRTVALQRQFFDRLTDQVKATEEAFFFTMSALARAAELNDFDTGNHIARVNAHAAAIAERLGCSREFTSWISHCAQMHDVGKISVPASILRKPGPLDDDEWAWIRKHPALGAQILGDSPRLAMPREIALCHHENWDGSGYPSGLAGEAIPVSARIVKMADVYDALRSQRPYKRALSHDQTLHILTRGDERVSPSHFDPAILEVVQSFGEDLLAIDRSMADSAGAKEYEGQWFQPYPPQNSN
jgi:response regulator RpfG family c-di-GMP phosphodiesterase